MKKILILVSKYGVNLKLAEFLKEKLKGKFQVFYHAFSEIAVEISQGKVEVCVAGISLSDFDLIYFRKVGKKYLSLAGVVALYLDKKGIHYVDSVFGDIGPAGSKLYSLTKLALSGLPVVPTFYFSKDFICKDSKKIGKKLGYPFIAKDVSLQKLKGVFVIRNKNDITKLLSGDREGYIFQQFIEIKKEYRLLVLGKVVGAAHTKVPRTYENFKVDYLDWNSKEEYLNVEKLPAGLIKMAVMSAKILGLEIAGVDLAILADNKPVIIEVNRGPGFSPDSKVSPEYREVSRFLLSMIMPTNRE